MEQLVAVARTLREVHQFRGYIHLKTIPDADPAPDRRSRPLGRPPVASTSSCRPHDSVTKLAPEKSVHTIKLAMGSIRRKLDEKAEEPRRPRLRRPARARR